MSRAIEMRIAFLVFIYVLPLSSPVKANFLSDFWGILTDPVKIGKGTSNIIEAIERAAIHAERIEGKTNADIEKRLNQIDHIAKDAIENAGKLENKTSDDVDRIVTKSLDKINDIQGEILKNTSNLIKCAAEVSSDIVLSKISGSLNDLGLKRPRVTIFGYSLFEVKFDKTDFDTPIGGFRKYQEITKKKLSEINFDDPAYIIADIYGEVQRTADLVRCHYKTDSGLFLDLYQTELEYNRRGLSWVGKYDSEYRKLSK